MLAQIQMGNDIMGSAAGYPYSTKIKVSMPDNETVAVSASILESSPPKSFIKVYNWNGSIWVQKGTTIYPPNPTGNSFGRRIQMPHKNWLVTSGFMGHGSPGRVFIYRWDGYVWQTQAIFQIPGVMDEYFGKCFHMPDTNTLAVGAPADYAPFANGEVYIYKRIGNQWFQKGDPILGEQYFGDEVFMSDSNTVAISNTKRVIGDSSVGSVEVFSWDGAHWVQKGFTVYGTQSRTKGTSNFGQELQMGDKNTLACLERGLMHIYAFDGVHWTRKGKFFDASAPKAFSVGGFSMPGPNTLGVIGWHDTLSVFLFGWDGSDWIVKSSFVNNNLLAHYYPEDISMGNLNTMAIGFPDTLILNVSRGLAQVFSVCNVNTWVQTNDPTLTSLSQTGTLQWLDCSNGFAPIPGATNQSYTPIINGSFAVSVQEGQCLDTSSCHSIVTLSYPEESADPNILVYPNPTMGEFHLNLGNLTLKGGERLVVRNIMGQTVLSEPILSHQCAIQMHHVSTGVYFLDIITSKGTINLKVLKQ